MNTLKLISRTIKPGGFIKVIDVCPRVIPSEFINNLKCDYSIVEAARVSYSKGTKKVSDDASLIKYLYSHEHTTPFEMVTFKFHIKAPLFVVRQWQRHRMSCFNEISGRYSVIENSFWYPEEFRKQAVINKQSSSDGIEYQINQDLLYEYKLVATECYNFYDKLLNSGVSREMARTILPLNTYTEFYWKIDLHNLLRFIKLRNDKHAQEEIRLYAYELKKIVKEYCPVTMDAFENFTEKSIKFSNEELKIITKEENIESLKSKSGKADFINKINKIKEY